MRIAVFGASGGCGRRLVALAEGRGHDVVAVVREGSAAAFPEPVTVRRCDPYAGTGVDDAVVGADAVVSCIGIRRRHPINPWSRLTSPRDTTERCTANIVDAMTKHGVGRIACVSAAGVGASRADCSFPIRLLIERTNLGPAYRDLERMEAALAASPLDWLALRPTTLTNGSGTRYRSCERYGQVSRVSRSAVAMALLDFVEDRFERRGPAMITGGAG